MAQSLIQFCKKPYKPGQKWFLKALMCRKTDKFQVFLQKKIAKKSFLYFLSERN